MLPAGCGGVLLLTGALSSVPGCGNGAGWGRVISLVCAVVGGRRTISYPVTYLQTVSDTQA
jgi:hypothetical protein